MTFEPTAEQSSILAAFTAGKHLVVQAGAGTGKTTTLKLLARSTDAKGTYLAFNKSIAAEAKLAFPNSVRAMTAHSLAWQEHGRQFADRMNAERTGWGPTIQFLNAQPMSFRLPDKTRRNLTAYHIARHAIETVKTYCQSDDAELSRRHVPVIPGLDYQVFGARRLGGENHDLLADRVLPMAHRVWADVQKTTGVIQYDHSFYLKAWALTHPTIDGDYLMFDEAQDASPVIAGVVNRQTHLQRILVGDSAQQIMAFAGAQDAMEKFARNPDVKVLSLTESFRFGPVIAAAANSLLTELSAPLRLTGTPTVDSTITVLDGNGPAPTPSDAVLCRTNAGALDELITLQHAGRRVCLLGGANDLRRFVEAAQELQNTGKTNFVSLMAFESWAQVEEHVANDPAGGELETMVELVNTYGVRVLLSALNACVHENTADVIVSTAHKAKGREWDAVRISGDFELDPEASPESRDAEMMLAYVAITRAKKLLDPGLLAQAVKASPAPVAVPAASAPQDPTETPQGPGSADVDMEDPVTAQEAVTEADEPPFGVPANADAVVGRFVPVSSDLYERLVVAAEKWGGTPDEFAARLLEGALFALSPQP